MSQPAAMEFIENMGLSAEADGLPRIAGRMWGFFIIHDGAFAFADLAERLQVSRGSISTNARILRDLGILERVARAGDRQDYYRLAEQPFDRLLVGYVERMRATQKHVDTALAGLPATAAGAHRRLGEMREFYDQAVHHTESLIEQLRRESRQVPA